MVSLPTTPTGFMVSRRPTKQYVVNDFSRYLVAPVPRPAKGVPLADQVFGTDVVRVVDSVVDLGCKFSYAGWCRHDSENCDGTMFTIHSWKYPTKHVVNANPPYEIICDLPIAISTDYDPDWRWSPTERTVLYATQGSKFLKHNIVTAETMLIRDFQKDFPDLPIFRVYGKEGGNPSVDGRYWCWMIRCFDTAHDPDWWDERLIVYDLPGDRIVASTPCGFANFTGVSPLGNYAIVDQKMYSDYHDMLIYPLDLSQPRTIRLEITVHAFPGVGLDDTGEEVLVWVEQYGDLGYWVCMADLETGTKHYLAPFGTSPLFNASAVSVDTPGWAAVCCNDGNPDNWASGQIMMVELSRRIAKPDLENHTKVWRVCHTHSKVLDHSDEIFCKLNRKGTRIYFRTGWGGSTVEGAPVDTYFAALPGTWYSDLAARSTYRVNDTTFYPTIQIPKPKKGESYVDPVNGLTVTRITDMDADFGPYVGFHGASCGYPKHNIENADKTKLVIQTYGNPNGTMWSIYNRNAPYSLDHQISDYWIRWGKPIDFRWDNVNPNIGYYILDNKLMRYNIVTRQPELIRDFNPDLALLYPGTPFDGASCGLAEEGDASDDRRYWAIRIVATTGSSWWHHGVFIYDMAANQIIASMREGDPQFNYCGDASMSPDGNWVILGNRPFIYPRNLSSFRVPNANWGHSDLAYSAEGRPVIATASATTSRFAMVDLETGEITELAPINPNPAWHISGNSHRNPGWCLVSNYGPSVGTPESAWGDHEIFLVELTKRTSPAPRIIRVAQTRTAFGDYFDSPFAKLNMDGTAVYFGSGWGISRVGPQPNLYSPGQSYDVYRVDIPLDIYEAW